MMMELRLGNGKLRGLRFCRTYVYRSNSASRSSLQQVNRRFHASPASSLAADASSTSPAEADATKAAKKTGRAFKVFVGVAAAAVVGSLVYPTLVGIPPLERKDPDVVPPPTEVPLPSKETVEALPAPIANVIPVRLSPREELTQRVEVLHSDLDELRKLKRTKLVDMKKQGIKDEIKMITDGLKKLDKAR